MEEAPPKKRKKEAAPGAGVISLKAIWNRIKAAPKTEGGKGIELRKNYFLLGEVARRGKCSKEI